MNQLANMNDLKERLSEQIKVSIFNLLPEDKIAELVENEINAFFEPGSADFWLVEEDVRGWNASTKEGIKSSVSPFRLIVWNQLSQHLKNQLKEIFESPEFLSRCKIGDGQVKADIQSSAMTRQEQVVLSMATVMFGRMVDDSLLMAAHDTTSALQMAVRDVMMRNKEL